MSSACWRGNECPAGPDVGPHGSSPNQQNALVMAPAFRRASEPFRWFTSLRRRPRCGSPCGETSFFAESAGSGRDRPVVVLAALGCERIDDPRQLVGERHRGQLELVLDGLALEHPARPTAQGVVMPFAVAKRRAGALNQQLA